MTDPARLYLITPVVDDADAFVPALTAALDAAPVDCLLLRLPPHDDGLRRKIAVALTPLVQERGTALLIEDDTRLAAAVGADGVHMQGAGDAFDQALRSMKPARIVGTGALDSRDAAMLAGEAGADYIMFGAPHDGAAPAEFEARLDRVGWWAEIFQVPCVAWAATLHEVEAFAQVGAEFIALEAAVWRDPRGPAAAMAAASSTLATVAAAQAAALADG